MKADYVVEDGDIHFRLSPENDADRAALDVLDCEIRSRRGYSGELIMSVPAG